MSFAVLLCSEDAVGVEEEPLPIDSRAEGDFDVSGRQSLRIAAGGAAGLAVFRKRHVEVFETGVEEGKEGAELGEVIAEEAREGGQAAAHDTNGQFDDPRHSISRG